MGISCRVRVFPHHALKNHCNTSNHSEVVTIEGFEAAVEPWTNHLHVADIKRSEPGQSKDNHYRRQNHMVGTVPNREYTTNAPAFRRWPRRCGVVSYFHQ